MPIYFDTNVFRYLGDTLGATALPEPLAQNVVLSPISVAELLTQLTTREGQGVLDSIKNMLKWLPDCPSYLAWPDSFIASVLGEGATPTDLSDQIIDDLLACVHADSPQQLREPAGRLKDALDSAKCKQAEFNQRLFDEYRANDHALTELTRAFAHGIAARVGVQPGKRPDADIASAFGALFEFQTCILQKAVTHANYNFSSHCNLNNPMDAEQLLYLARTDLHLVSADKGFGCVQKSSQRPRIHIVKTKDLRDATLARETLFRIEESNDTTS